MTDPAIEALAEEILEFCSLDASIPRDLARRRWRETGHTQTHTVRNHWTASKARAQELWRAYLDKPRDETEALRAALNVPPRTSMAEPAIPLTPIPDGHRVKGVSTLVDAQGNMQGQWIKTTKDPESAEEILARLVATLPATVAARDPLTGPHVDDTTYDLMAVYPLGDPHVGLLAWAPESGADFDLKICEDLMVRAMRDLVLRGPRAKRALIVNLGDFFHADNPQGHTTKGEHTLDLDGRSPRVLAIGMRIMTALIDAALEHHHEVTVDNRIGNHDGHTSLMLSIALAAYYRNEARVSIPATVAHRAYYEHGQNLIGVTHGDRAKGEDLTQIMAAEVPEAWGRTRHRVWYCGHVHHQSLKEYRGCRVESFRTLAARDSWHAAQGYVAGRDMHRIVLSATKGEISREVVNVEALIGGMRQTLAPVQL